MNLKSAKLEINKFFQKCGTKVSRSKLAGSEGKVYELYCLGKTIDYLTSFPGVSARYVGNKSIDFKRGPGLIDTSKSYFIVSWNGRELELHTNIEVKTLSFVHGRGVAGKSSHHEIDLVLLLDPVNGERPSYKKVVLGIECKAHGTFEKGFVRQVLGMRRELSFYEDFPLPSLLTFLGIPSKVRARPPSEFWLAFPNPEGKSYESGPNVFGVKFKHWCP